MQLQQLRLLLGIGNRKADVETAFLLLEKLQQTANIRSGEVLGPGNQKQAQRLSLFVVASRGQGATAIPTTLLRFLVFLSEKRQSAVIPKLTEPALAAVVTADTPSPSRDPARWVRRAALLFAVLGLLVQLWRWWSLTASYDQGIFTQVLWNTAHGRWFASSLSSQLSSAVLHGGTAPDPTYQRLGQHFTPMLLLWTPLVRLVGAAALPLVQVALMTAAGLALHRLARHLLPAGLAAALACSFYGAQAVIGPTWCNFHDLCQLPLLVFLLLIGLLERRWWLLLLAAALMPLIREDTGVVLFGMAIWMGVRRQAPWPVALLLALWGSSWTVLVTSVLMPAVSDDVSRRFMVENFGQYSPGAEELSSLEVVQGLLLQPWRLAWELIHPPGKTLGYLAAQWLPLMFVPAISLDAWLLVALPLAGLLLARGSNDPLAINIRYALLVAPGLFAGAVFWWRQHAPLFARRRLQRIWLGCVALSLLLTLASNPNRSLSFLVPDSVAPWVHLPLMQQLRHGAAARQVLQLIPPQASVAANTPLIPLLAERTVVLRVPAWWQWQQQDGTRLPVDWVAVDLQLPAWRSAAFASDARQERLLQQRLEQLQADGYVLRAKHDGVVLLERVS